MRLHWNAVFAGICVGIFGACAHVPTGYKTAANPLAPFEVTIDGSAKDLRKAIEGNLCDHIKKVDCGKGEGSVTFERVPGTCLEDDVRIKAEHVKGLKGCKP